MNKIPKFFVTALISFSFVSCIHQRSFVATPVEPLLVREKGDMEIGGGMRPFRYYNLNVTGAISDMFAVRLGYGGNFGLNNYNASFFLFKNYSDFGFFVGPGFNYQHNFIKFKWGIGANKTYQYNCKYYSPNVTLGLNLGGTESKYLNQFILKLQFNQVEQYQYSLHHNNGSGKSGSLSIHNDENLTYDVPDFASLEFSYVLLKKIGKVCWFKLQPGFLLFQKTFIHNYQYIGGGEGRREIVDGKTEHPQSLGFNINICWIWKWNTLPKKSEPVQPLKSWCEVNQDFTAGNLEID